MKKSFDEIYKDIVDTIAEKGIWSEGNVRTKYADGTAAHYKSYIGYQFRLDNSDDEAHLITSRFAPSKAPIRELYWIWILQSNNVDVLDELGCKFWDEWSSYEIDNTKITYIIPKIKKQKPLKKIKVNEIINYKASVFLSKDYGEYYVLEEKEENNIKFKKIQFKNTGYIKYVSKYKKNPKDPYKRTVFGVGYYGETNKPEIKEYFGENFRTWIRKWENIIKRCAGKADRSKWYKNVFVGETFQSCELFLEWVMKNNFYGKDELKNLDIDKDYYKSNCYDADTCTLIRRKQNVNLTLKEWYQYDNLYFFSKTELAKYFFKEKSIKEVLKKDGSLNNREIDKYIKSLTSVKKIKIIKNEINKDNKIPRFILKPIRSINKCYGYQINKNILGYKNQLDYIIGELKKNPNSRRVITELWNVKELGDMNLQPCVHLTQWSVIGNKLYLEVRQRSCDVALGLVANVFQYSVLHKLVALECGLEPAEIIWNIHNVHIYDRHYDKLIKQVNGETFEPAKIKINNFKSIFDFKPDDIEILDYKYGEKISYEIAI